MKIAAYLPGLLLVVGCLGAESGMNTVSAGQQTSQLARFDGLFLTNATLRYQDCHAFLSWVDHEAHLDAEEKMTICAKLKEFLDQKAARPLAADCADLTGVAAPEAILRAYAARLIGKHGITATSRFLRNCRK